MMGLRYINMHCPILLVRFAACSGLLVSKSQDSDRENSLGQSTVFTSMHSMTVIFIILPSVIKVQY